VPLHVPRDVIPTPGVGTERALCPLRGNILLLGVLSVVRPEVAVQRARIGESTGAPASPRCSFACASGEGTVEAWWTVFAGGVLAQIRLSREDRVASEFRTGQTFEGHWYVLLRDWVVGEGWGGGIGRGAQQRVWGKRCWNPGKLIGAEGVRIVI